MYSECWPNFEPTRIISNELLGSTIGVGGAENGPSRIGDRHFSGFQNIVTQRRCEATNLTAALLAVRPPMTKQLKLDKVRMGTESGSDGTSCDR